jgi:hypothetical protein
MTTNFLVPGNDKYCDRSIMSRRFAAGSTRLARSEAEFVPGVDGVLGADGVPIDTPRRFVSLTVLAARNGPASVVFVTDP